MKTINIKGKQYVEVNERLRYFRVHFENYSLTSEVIEKTDSTILIKATIKDKEGRELATGLAEEEKGSSFINKTSYVENCETSAWGRCLGNFGIGIDTSVASADEVSNAINQQGNKTIPVKPKATIQHTLDLGDENWDKVLKYVSENKEMGLTKIVNQLKRKYDIKTEVKKEISNLIKTKK
ncbi:MAG: hypothetical protein ACTSQA_02155 [Candidatus Heimdallarchaeaceae archaeon]